MGRASRSRSKETLADANRPSHYVEFGGKDAIGIPSPEPISPGASGGAARIVLLAASGQSDKEIAASMAITPKKVFRWRKRFLALGVEGLQKDAHRPGRKLTIGTRLTKRVVTMTTRQRPANATHFVPWTQVSGVFTEFLVPISRALRLGHFRVVVFLRHSFLLQLNCLPLP
jgi:hypothetical protein